MTVHVGDAKPDVHEMVVIHRIFRQGFTMVADAARRTTPADSVRAEAVERHLVFLLNGLHHHHEAEDEYLWPPLSSRVGVDAGLVARMEEQHEALADRIAAVQRLLADWTPGSGGEELAVGIGALQEALAPHLDEEEREILPLVAEHITGAEWRQMGDAAFDGFTNPEKLLALGQMLDVATPEEAVSFLDSLPAPVRFIWWAFGRRNYARHMRALRGES